MKTHVVVFPFELFGGAGSAAGALLLADALRELLDDNAREKIPTRARAYQDLVKLSEFAFEKQADYDDWRGKATKAARQAWKKGELLLWLAGNHLGVLPLYDALARDPEGTLVVQLDAHLDIFNLSDCTAELSHGNFLLHCDGTLPTVINLGHRELLLRPDYVAKYYHRAFSAAELAIDPEPAMAYLRAAVGPARRVLIDLDCDVFDPAYFPATAHGLPFGLSPTTVLRLLNAAWSESVVGVAVSEFEPGRDIRDGSLATVVWLLEWLLLKKYGN